MDRVVESDRAALVRAYERKIEEIEIQKAVLLERIAACGRPLRSFDETFRTAIEYLGNPRKLWNSNFLADKRAVLKLTFAERLVYNPKQRF